MKNMSIADFVDEGYLLELNRRFLHPMGLALEYHIESKTGETKLGDIRDYREETGGVYFRDPDERQNKEAIQKVKNIKKLWNERVPPRVKELGYMIQPIP